MAPSVLAKSVHFTTKREQAALLSQKPYIFTQLSAKRYHDYL
jgi:hypothetical protein